MARKRSQKKSSMVTTPHVGAQKGLGVRTVTKTGIQESDKENFPVELPPRDSLDYMRLRRKFNVHSRDDIECLSMFWVLVFWGFWCLVVFCFYSLLSVLCDSLVFR